MTKVLAEWRQINRCNFIKNADNMCVGAFMAGFGVSTYSFKLEGFWYQINEVQLKVRNLPKAFAGWKIVQFSDVHLGFHYENKDFHKVIQLINSLNPDMIFLKGITARQ